VIGEGTWHGMERSMLARVNACVTEEYVCLKER
jgi:hypothetical protein